jgi:hypothetical protein
MWTSPRAPRPWRRRLFSTLALLALLVPALAALAAYPVVDVNTGMTIGEGDTAKKITSSMLRVSMQNTPASSIQYQLTSAPAHGALKLDGNPTPLIAGNTFTQDDIDNGRLAYSHDGSETTSDSFDFSAAEALRQRMTRVSVASDGAEGNGRSYDSSALSKDGRFVAFRSAATNLVIPDTNGVDDIFVHDQQTGQTTRVSVDSNGNQGNGGSFRPALSADGNFVAFDSVATNLFSGDTNNASDVFLYDVPNRQTTRVSVGLSGVPGNSASFSPSISENGNYVAFLSYATNLVSGDTNNAGDIFVRDRQMGQTTRVSVDSNGNQANDDSYDLALSANGLVVAFYSVATNLVSGDTNTCGSFTAPGSCSDVFVRDLVTKKTTRVSVASDGAQANGGSYSSALSQYGDFVAFESDATNLVSDDTNNVGDIFVHDRQTGRTERVSVDSRGNQANSVSYDPSISADGRFVAFHSLASNLVEGDTNNTEDVFVHDRKTGQTTRVSVASDGAQANGGSSDLSLSADGRAVAFYSNATNLVSGDTNGTDDIFVADRGIAQSFAISVTPVNDPPTLSSFADQTVLSSSAITIPFQVGDEETPVDQLSVTPSSLNQALVPNGNLSIVGDKANRNLVVRPGQPVPGEINWATIKVQVKDKDSNFTTEGSFTLTVQPPPQPPPPPWLALLYLAGDDTTPGTGQTGLTGPLLNLLARLRTMPPNPAMRLVVLYDGDQAGDSALYVREPGQSELNKLQTPQLPDWFTPELNTGITATLHNFIAWARKTYPGSPHTLLSIVDHGGGWAPTAGAFGQPRGTTMVKAGGWTGLALDAQANGGVGTSLSTKATGEALAGLGHFDVLFLDACLMGMIETATEVQPYADYLVAGENLLWSRLPYEKYLDPKVLTPTTDPRALAQAIGQYYNEPKPADEPFTIAALDLSQLPKLVQEVDNLAQQLLAGLNEEHTAETYEAYIRAAYEDDTTQKFDYDSSFSLDKTDAYVDLADLAAQLLEKSKSPEYSIDWKVTDAATQVRNQIVGSAGEPGVVVGTPKAVSGTYYAKPTLPAWNFAGAHGLSIYLPLGERDCRPTGLLLSDEAFPALAPCEPPATQVHYQVEPQLNYYIQPEQLRFSSAEGAPEWAALLERLDPRTPNRTKSSPIQSPFPAASRTLVYLPLVRK